MTIYDEIEIEDMDYDAQIQTFLYNCPCGDKFRVTISDLMNGEDIAECPSCTLRIKVIFDKEDLQNYSFTLQEEIMC